MGCEIVRAARISARLPVHAVFMDYAFVPIDFDLGEVVPAKLARTHPAKTVARFLARFSHTPTTTNSAAHASRRIRARVMAASPQQRSRLAESFPTRPCPSALRRMLGTLGRLELPPH
jgi:hypothetical protein